MLIFKFRVYPFTNVSVLSSDPWGVGGGGRGGVCMYACERECGEERDILSFVHMCSTGMS